MTDAATFIAQAIPWPTTAMPGYVNIHSPYLRPGAVKPVMPGHAFTDVNEALGNIAWRVHKNNDVYACMSLQKDAHDPKGKRNRGAMRAAERAVSLKSFWLDADAKNFTDEQDLLTKFGVFRRAVGLPVPSLINWSGGGAHFYWVLPDAIAPAVWQPLASALAEACRQHNFRADHQCTVNAGQLMRIPGTENHKYTPPRQAHTFHLGTLTLLADMEGPLQPYRTAYRRPVNSGTPRRRLSLPPGSKPSKVFDGMVLGPSLADGLDLGQPTAQQVADACPWFADILGKGGANSPEPEWFEALKVAYHTKEGQQTAHDVSDLHPDYSRQATDEKYETASASAEQYGWPQCRTIQSSGATQCAACPHVNSGKSPLNFSIIYLAPNGGATSAPPPPPPPSPGPTPGTIPGTSQTGPVIPFMPTGYRYDTHGFIEHMIKSEDRKSMVWEKMYPVRVNGFVRQTQNKELKFGKEMLYFQYEDNDGFRDVQLTYAEVHDPRAFRTVLPKQGMGFKDHEAQNMGRFMVSFVQQLRNAPHLSVECEPYGWAMKNGKVDGFTYDGTRFNCSGNKKVMPTDVGLGEKFKSTGDIAIWRDACKLVTDQQRPGLNTILACGFAAPLVQFTGHNGFVISAYSTATGVQKSAAMRVSQAVWGNPVNGMAGLDDTNNFLNTRLGMLRHLPLFVDELRFVDEVRRAETLVLGITQGKTKGKLTRDSQTMETYTFNTMMVTASNTSLVQYISEHSKTTTAGMARIFEFVVEKHHDVGIVDSNRAQAVIGGLEYNYGHAGRIYAEFLGKNIDRVRDDVQAMCATIGEIVKGTTDERFWVAAIAVLILGAQYGKELGLLDVDMTQLSQFLLAQFKKQRGETAISSSNIGSVSTVERYVLDFINSHPQQTIRTDTVDTTPGRSVLKPVVLNDINSIMNLSRGVSIHLIRDLKLVRISASDFGRWLAKEHKVSRHEVIKKIKELLPAKEMKVSIGRGTIYKRTPEAVLEFDASLMTSVDLFN